jgi:hypothetical protein
VSVNGQVAFRDILEADEYNKLEHTGRMLASNQEARSVDRRLCEDLGETPTCYKRLDVYCLLMAKEVLSRISKCHSKCMRMSGKGLATATVDVYENEVLPLAKYIKALGTGKPIAQNHVIL